MIGVFLRIGAGIVLGAYNDPQDWEYGDIAENIANHRGFARMNEFSGKIERTSSHAPIYPFFLSVFYSAGQKPLLYMAVLFLQIIVAALTALIFYRISLIIFNSTAAFITMLGMTFYPPLVYYSIKLTPLIFTIFFIGLTLLISLKTRKGEYKKAFLAGSFMGISILTDPITIVLFPAIVIWALWKKQLAVKTVAFIGLAGLIILCPWTIRNYQVHQRIVLVTTQFGKNLWIGNNDHATGTDYYRVTKNGKDQIVLMTHTLPRKDKTQLARLSEIDQAGYFTGQAVAFIKREPGKFIDLFIKKTLYFWTFTPARINGSPDASRYRCLHMFFYIPLFILAVYGIIISTQPRYINDSILILSLIVMIASIYIFTHIGLVRYRMPIEVLLIMYGAMGIACFRKNILGRGRE
jgi:hypothetical protein